MFFIITATQKLLWHDGTMLVGYNKTSQLVVVLFLKKKKNLVVLKRRKHFHAEKDVRVTSKLRKTKQ